MLSSLGAGDGNRTHVTSLEGWNSTIELHPQGISFLLFLCLTTYIIIARLSGFVNRLFEKNHIFCIFKS